MLWSLLNVFPKAVFCGELIIAKYTGKRSLVLHLANRTVVTRELFAAIMNLPNMILEIPQPVIYLATFRTGHTGRLWWTWVLGLRLGITAPNDGPSKGSDMG